MSIGDLTVSIIGDMSGLTKTISQASSAVGNFGSSVTSKIGSALSTVGKAAAVAGTALGAGLAVETYKSVTAFQDFEKSVSNAASVTGLTGDAFRSAKENISAVAQELGQKTAFSSSQAANAMYDLASAGYDVSKMTSSQLKPMLDLAAGTQYDLARTTATTAGVLSMFNLKFEDAGRVSDVFSKASGSTAANMEKLSGSYEQVGNVAQLANMSLEDTTAALGLMYNAQMDGSSAGTGLKGVLASLLSPTKTAADALAKMGLTVEDVNPTTNKFSDVVQKLADHGLNATNVFDIFGREAAPAIVALTSKAGDLKTLTAELQNAGGTAETMATQQLDTLDGSLQALSGSIENLMINVGQALAPTIRQFADSFNSMIPSIQTWIVAIVTGFSTFVSQLGGSVSAITSIGGTIADIFKNIFNSFSGNSDVESGLANTINGIMTQIAGIVQSVAPTIQNAIIGIITFFKQLVTDLAPTWQNLQDIAMMTLDVFNAFFSGLSSGASSGVASTIAGVVNVISEVFWNLASTILWASTAIGPTVNSIFTGISGAFSSVLPDFATIQETLSNWSISIAEVLSNLSTKLGPTWENLGIIFDAGGRILSSAVKSIGETFGSLTSSLTSGSSITSVTDTIANALNSITTAIANFTMSVAENGLSGAIEQAFNIDIPDLSPVWNGLKGAFGKITKTITDFIKSLSETGSVEDALEKTFNIDIPDLDIKLPDISQIWNGLKSAFDTGKKIIKGFATDLEPSWDNLKESFKSIQKIISDVSPSFTGLFKSFSGPDAGTAVTVGSALAGVINTITGAIAGILKFAADHPKITQFVVAVAALATGLAGLSVIAGIISTALASLGLAIGTALGGIVATITGFAGAVGAGLALITSPFALVIGAVVLLYLAWTQNWFGIRDKAAEVWNWLKIEAGNFVTGLQTHYNNAISTLTTYKNQAIGAWTLLQAYVKLKYNELIADAQAWIAQQVTKYNDAISKITTFKNQALGAWALVKATIQAKFNEIIADAQTWIANQVAKYNDAVSKITTFKNQVFAAWSLIKATIKLKLDEIITDVQTWYNNLVTKFTNVKTALTNTYNDWKKNLTDIYNAVVTKKTEILNQIQLIINGIWDKGKQFYNSGASLLTNLKKGIDDKIPGIKEAINGLTGWIDRNMPHSPAKEGPLSRLPNFAGYITTPLQKAVTSATSTAKSAGSSIISSISSGIKTAASSVYNAASSALKKVSSLLPHSPAKEGPFKTLPDWDAVFLDPMTKSLAAVRKMDVSGVLSGIRDPIDASIRAGSQNIQNVSNSSYVTHEGSTIQIGPNNFSNDMDLQKVVRELEKIIIMKGRQEGTI